MVCGENPLVEAKKAFFGKRPFLGREIDHKAGGKPEARKRG
jgi:hypothetical protein